MGNARQRAARKKLAQSGDGGEPNVVLKKQNSENHGAEVLESGKKKKISGPKKRKRNDEGENVGNDDGEVVQSVSNGSEKAESGDNLKVRSNQLACISRRVHPADSKVEVDYRSTANVDCLELMPAFRHFLDDRSLRERQLQPCV